jgi:hypothetical protein
MARADGGLPRLTRRDWLRLASAGVVGASSSGWIEAMAAASPRPAHSCILLWMAGGPSQIDTFDPKPGHKNGGPLKPIETAVPGILFGEHLPKLARHAGDIAVVRSMSTQEGDHGRATYHLRTGYLPQGPVRFPTLGSLVVNELEDASAELPSFVSIAPQRGINPAAFTSGFLGPRCAPLIVGETPAGSGADALNFQVEDIDLPPGIGRDRAEDRLALMDRLADRFVATRPGLPSLSHRDAYMRAVRMMRSSAAKAFDLDVEPAALRDAYGRNAFGQGCLLARRLVERGVRFVEVTFSGLDANNALGWDTHIQNFEAMARLCGALDAGWSTLMADLRSRGLLDETLIVWMGEFGRTPQINDQSGRDHYPNAWSTVLAGGGIRGGQAFGDTGDDGAQVKDRPLAVADLLSTVMKAVDIDSSRQNLADNGRPIRLADIKGKPVAEIVG